MFKFIIKWIINFRLTAIIKKDKSRNHWNDERMARTLCCSVEHIKKIQRSPATVPTRELYRFVRLCLDLRSQEAISFLSIDMQFWAYRLNIPTLVSVERKIKNHFIRSVSRY